MIKKQRIEDSPIDHWGVCLPALHPMYLLAAMGSKAPFSFVHYTSEVLDGPIDWKLVAAKKTPNEKQQWKERLLQQRTHQLNHNPKTKNQQRTHSTDVFFHIPHWVFRALTVGICQWKSELDCRKVRRPRIGTLGLTNWLYNYIVIS
jgi:hypothetical protein